MTTTTDLSPKQLAAVRESIGRVNVWTGAIRAGKTISSLLRWLLYVARAPISGQLVVVARTREAAARNVFASLQNPELFGEAAQYVNYTPGAPTATILGRVVHVLGASDAKAEKVLRGLTCAGAYVDELTVIPEEFFTQLLGRLSVPGAKIFATTNPDNPAHWLKRKFLDRLDKLPDWRHWAFVLDDNPSLDEDYKASIRREYTGLWYRRFILGEWVAAEGAVYDMWDPARHVVPWEQLPAMARLLACGVDHGTTNASAGIVLGLGTDGVLYAVDEWWLDGSTMPEKPTVAQQSEALRDFLAGPHLPPDAHGRPVSEPPIEWVVVDPAAASFRTQLHHDGVSSLANADNDVHYGIPLVASLLGARQLKVADRCEALIREVPGYAWDPKATAKGEDKPIKVADHALDALRYGIVTTETNWRGSVTNHNEKAA